MKVTSTGMYLITRLDRICFALWAAAALGLVLAIFFGMTAIFNYDLARTLAITGEKYATAAARHLLWARRALAVAAVALVSAILTPSTKEAEAIFALKKDEEQPHHESTENQEEVK